MHGIRYVVLSCLFGATACVGAGPDPAPCVPVAEAPRHHVAYLLGPFRYPTRQEDVADELRERGWQIAEQLADGVDIIVVGTGPDIATCGGLPGRPGATGFRIDGLPGLSCVTWSQLSMQLLCDDLAR